MTQLMLLRHVGGMPPRRLCSYHKTGVPYPDVKAHQFFQRGCYRCAEKLAAGIVSGNEPPPPKHASFEQAFLRHSIASGDFTRNTDD